VALVVHLARLLVAVKDALLAALLRPAARAAGTAARALLGVAQNLEILAVGNLDLHLPALDALAVGEVSLWI
jgi:hypothetical protein